MQAQQTSLLLTAMLNRRMLICVMTGLASGMPLYLLIQLVPAWLRAPSPCAVETQMHIRIELGPLFSDLFHLELVPHRTKWAELLRRN